MSSPDDPFKIIIVGGGIAGLTLANMLEKFEIDYILLEARDNIAPAVGASIGLFPNGLLILDQIGCYEPVRAVAQGDSVKYAHMRRPDGSSVSCTEDLFAHLKKRYVSCSKIIEPNFDIWRLDTVTRCCFLTDSGFFKSFLISCGIRSGLCSAAV